MGTVSRAVLRHVLIGPAVKVGTRLRVEGREHVPPPARSSSPRTTWSFMDSMVIPIACRGVHFLGKAEYFQGTGLRGLRCAGSTPRRHDPGRPERLRGRPHVPRARRGGAPPGRPRRLPRGDPALRTAAAPRPHRCGRMAVSTGATSPCAVIGTDRVHAGLQQLPAGPGDREVRASPSTSRDWPSATRRRRCYGRSPTRSWR